SKHAPHHDAQAQGKPQPTNAVHRMAEGDGFVTRGELNDALGKLADSHKETQKQQTCDLLTALRAEIRDVIAEGPNGPGLPPASSADRSLPSRPGPTAPQYTSPFRPTRAADPDDYARNAYGDDMRDAPADDYERNAYGDEVRDAGYDERDADGYEARDASVYDERDADGYEAAA